MTPTAIKFYDLFGDCIGEFDAYAIDALIRDGVDLIGKGGAVHFDLGGRAFFYRGHFIETRYGAIQAFRQNLESVSTLNKRVADARMWFIMSVCNAGVFWSNEHGWSSVPEHAEIFSDKERGTVRLPPAGIWVEA